MHMSRCHKTNGIHRPTPWRWLVLQGSVLAAAPAVVRCPPGPDTAHAGSAVNRPYTFLLSPSPTSWATDTHSYTHTYTQGQARIKTTGSSKKKTFPIGRHWRQKFKSWTNQIARPFAPPTSTLLGDLPCLSSFLTAWLHPVKNVISTVLVLLTILGMIRFCQPPSRASFFSFSNWHDGPETEASDLKENNLYLFCHLRTFFFVFYDLIWFKMIKVDEKNISQPQNLLSIQPTFMTDV